MVKNNFLTKVTFKKLTRKQTCWSLWLNIFTDVGLHLYQKRDSSTCAFLSICKIFKNLGVAASVQMTAFCCESKTVTIQILCRYFFQR